MRKYILFSFMGLCCLAFAGEAPISKCNEAKVQGACSDMVQTAVNVCEDKQSGKDITAKRLKDAKESNMNIDSNFNALIDKYKRLEDSSRTDAQNQKACHETATALKKDCVDYCDKNDENGANCNKSLYSLDQIRTFCKKNEEEAMEMAAMAATDANMLANRNQPTPPNLGTTPGGAGAVIKTPTIEYGAGYSSGSVVSDGSAADGSNSSAVTDALTKGLLGSSGASGGAGSGAAVGGDDSSVGSTATGKKIIGTGLSGAESGSGTRSESSGLSSQATGKSDAASGYMFWGVPPRKKKAPLSLLPPKKVEAAKKNEPTKKPASTQAPQTQLPSGKE